LVPFIMADGIPIPGRRHPCRMRLVHAHLTELMIEGVKEGDLVRLLEQLHSIIGKNKRHSFGPTYGRVQLADLAAPAQSAYLGEARIPHGERAARLSVALRSGLLTILLCASCPQPGEAVAINRTLPSEEFFDRQHVAAARIFE
jgi:hypothetical protein